MDEKTRSAVEAAAYALVECALKQIPGSAAADALERAALLFRLLDGGSAQKASAEPAREPRKRRVKEETDAVTPPADAQPWRGVS